MKTEKLKLTVYMLMFGYCLLVASAANAQFSVSERTFKKLNRAEKLIGQKEFKDAQNLLEALESSSASRKYELTLVYQAHGYLNYETNNIIKAIDYFEKSLALNSAPEPVLQNIRLNLIQMHAIENNFSKAIQHFDAWLKKEPKPTGDILALGGSIYAHAKQFDTAIKYLNQAIASTKEPRESWYRTLLSTHYEREDYPAAANLLEKLVSLQPDNKQYWNQLFSAYYLLNNFQKALSTLELAYIKNLLTNAEEITNLAKLYLYVGTPVKAVSLLNSEIQKGHLKQEAKTIELLGNAYLQARETEKAADTYLALAELNGDFKLYLKAARLYLDSKLWEKTLAALDKANNNVNQGEAFLMRGMALIELEDYDKATQAFREAQKQSNTRVSANQWLDFIDAQSQLH